MSVNRASTIFVLASWITRQLCDYIKLQWKCWPPLCINKAATISLPPPKHERQWSVNVFWSWIMGTQSAVHRRYFIINPSAIFVLKNATDNIATTQKWALMEYQQFLEMHPGWSKGYATVSTHNYSPGRLYGQKCYGWFRYHLLKICFNRASTIVGLASWTLRALCICIDP